ncbi:MAG: hypothetical protein M1276_05290 [Deltaproteobacteria bacterium]|jgi:hypothetical protein|nr:hypothetical protein [Deltaproteobacteria bacterium]
MKNQTKEDKIDKNKPERTVFRNLFERVKPDEKEKIKKKIDKKEIMDYTDKAGDDNNGN